MTRAARIAATGSALPRREVTNAELERMVDTSDEWIRSRTGIRSRRWAGGDETASSLAVRAGAMALSAAAIDPSVVDLTIVATISGDQPLPATAVHVQRELGTSGAAFDIAAACAGFVYGVDLAAAQLTSGRAEIVLVVGTEVLSRFLDLTDRTTCVLFGDGAGAAVITPGDEPGLLGSVLASDGRRASLLEIPAGGSREPASIATVTERRHTIRMADGAEVFRHAVTEMAAAAGQLLDKAGVTPDELALVVPHQANARIVRAVAQRLEVSADRLFLNLEHVGNTSSASVPIALDAAWRSGRLAPGDLILTVAFGAGLTWGANLIRWTAPRREAG